MHSIGDPFRIEPRNTGHIQERSHHVQINGRRLLIGNESARFLCAEFERAGIRSTASVCVYERSDDTISSAGIRANDLGKSAAKEKQAAAMLLTAEGRPFVYQGEELGYWGAKTGSGDEYVRTPMMWTKTGPYASAKLGGKIDKSMLTASISVEAQAEDGNSLLNVYRRFSMLRNSCPALAKGTMSPASVQGSSIAAWYMTSTDGQKVLVIHNLASSSKTVSVQDEQYELGTDTLAPVYLTGVETGTEDTLRRAAASAGLPQ